MAKILNVSDYGIGYDQGRSDGYQEGYDQAVGEYEKRVATLNAELQTMAARVAVLERKI